MKQSRSDTSASAHDETLLAEGRAVRVIASHPHQER